MQFGSAISNPCVNLCFNKGISVFLSSISLESTNNRDPVELVHLKLLTDVQFVKTAFISLKVNEINIQLQVRD